MENKISVVPTVPCCVVAEGGLHRNLSACSMKVWKSSPRARKKKSLAVASSCLRSGAAPLPRRPIWSPPPPMSSPCRCLEAVSPIPSTNRSKSPERNSGWSLRAAILW